MLRQMYSYIIMITYLIQWDKPYIRSPKNILEKFYEEPLNGFFILCRERGGVVINCVHVIW